MTIYVLILISGISQSPKQINIYVNTFNSKTKCEKRISEMSDFYKMTCVKTILNR